MDDIRRGSSEPEHFFNLWMYYLTHPSGRRNGSFEECAECLARVTSRGKAIPSKAWKGWIIRGTGKPFLYNVPF